MPLIRPFVEQYTRFAIRDVVIWDKMTMAPAAPASPRSPPAAPSSPSSSTPAIFTPPEPASRPRCTTKPHRSPSNNMQRILDRQGRRKFASHCKRVVNNYRPAEAELAWLTFLNVHGLASSETLYELTRFRPGVRNRHNFSEKLLRLWEAGFLFKPIGQRATVNADANFHVYDLAEKGREYLVREGLWVEALRPSGNFAHQLMVATITGTVDIGCRRAGYRYVPPHEYLAGKPLKADVPFAWEDGKHTCPLVPDAVFAIDYGNRSYVAYALEADRNNEPARARRWQRKSDLRTIRQYKSFIGGKQYQKAYGRAAKMMLLYITVSDGHARTFLDLVGEEIGSPAYVAVGALDALATPFYPPKLPMHLFDRPLTRAGREGWGIRK